MSLRVSISENATPRVQQMIDMAKPAWLARAHRAIGRRLVNLVRAHFLGLQATRHKTAQALGAAPTNFWGKAAESVSQPDALQADAGSARLGIAVPGIRRAQEDIDIYPTDGRQYLTIPIASESYGNRILQGEEPRFPGGFFFRSKKGNLLYATKEGKGKDAPLHLLYLLKPSVHQPQDRTLLPSDEEIDEAAQSAFRGIVEQTLQETNETIARQGDAA